jgi:hypothetical protein
MSSGISGLGVGIIGAGSLLIYAGIRGVSPLQALRDATTGKPVGIPNVPGSGIAQPVAASGNIGAAALAAAAAYHGDKYSELNRTQPGFSDCSSFVCKAFHDVGVPKPDGLTAWPTTGMFASSSWWQTIGFVVAGPGDIAVVPGKHMVFVAGPGGTTGLGQQNPTSNVVSGPISSLFAGVTGNIIYRRFIGPGS